MPEAIHPLNDLRKENYSWGTGKLKFFDIKPPLDDIILDNDQVKMSFDEYPIVPYAGREQMSSHKMVSVLYNFKDLSSTFAGVLGDFKSYALGRKVQIKKIEDSIFDIADEQIITDAEQRKFNDFLKENFIFHRSNVMSLSYMLLDSDESTGQVGVELIKKTILGKTTLTYKFHEPMDYVFLYGDRMGEEVAISKCWEYNYLQKHEPTIIPLYPYFQKYKDGYERSFYFKGRGAKLYGRPNDLSCLPDKYNEAKIKQYLTKKNKKLWLPDVFIETQDSARGGFTNEQDAQKAGFGNSKERIEANFTNAGDNASSFIVTNRANDAEQTYIHEFQGLKNSKEVMNFMQSFKECICTANGWSAMLLELKGATGLSTNMFLDLFSIKDVTKISEVQMNVDTMINELLQIGFKTLGAETQYGIQFVSPLKDLVSEYRNSKGGNIKQSSNEGTVEQTRTSV